MGKAVRFPCGKIYCNMGIWWWKSTHTLGEKMGTNFSGSSNSMDFIAFCHAMGNWWRNPFISHITKCTIGCESDGKKLPILSEKYVYQFSRFTTYEWFCRIFPEPISQVFLIWWVFLPFSMLWEIHEKTYGFPIWWSIPQDGNLMEKTIHFMENVRKPIFQAFPFWWVLLTFLMLWEIWWENPCIFHAMRYTIGWESNGKKHPYYGKGMSANFPGSPHTMGFVEYYREPISQAFPIRWVWLSLPMLWEIDEKILAFPLWWITP